MDQMRPVAKFATEEGLDQWQEVMRGKSRGEVLQRLLDTDKPKIIFTNPDVLFLILGLQYHVEPFEALRRYETLILDEFHLYQGVELAHGLAMVALARGFGIFSDDDCGMIHETQNWPQLRLYQDGLPAALPAGHGRQAAQAGESTPVSDLMGRQNHVFTVVPKREV